MEEYSMLKIYLSTTDKFGSKMMYEHLVYKAKELNVSGVTVNRGIMGFGMSSTRVTTSRFWELTEKLPVVVEMVDKTDVLKNYYKLVEPDLNSMKKGCLVSLGPVEILLLKPGNKGD
jgi:PII-like signaling protein